MQAQHNMQAQHKRSTMRLIFLMMVLATGLVAQSDVTPPQLQSFNLSAAALNGAVPGVGGAGTLVSFTLQGLAAGMVRLDLSGVSLLDETLFNIATTPVGASFVVTENVVPEPGSAAVLSLCLLLVVRRRRR
jgi:hypothetical protein